MDKPLTNEQLQKWLQTIILPGTTAVEHTNAPVPAGVIVKDLVNDSGKLSAAQHLAIYRQSYIARLRDCMKNQFRTLAYALGEDLFQGFADQYLDMYPSSSYTLNNLGQNFARFLSDTRPDAGQEIKESWPDFMIELADFEYTLSVIFDMQEDAVQLPADDTTPDADLLPVPTLYVFKHRFPVCQYYLAYSRKMHPDLPWEEESYCAVVRIHYKLGLYPIKAAQYHFLKQLKEGHTVSEAINYISSQFAHPVADVEKAWAYWRKSFIESGFFYPRPHI